MPDVSQHAPLEPHAPAQQSLMLLHCPPLEMQHELFTPQFTLADPLTEQQSPTFWQGSESVAQAAASLPGVTPWPEGASLPDEASATTAVHELIPLHAVIPFTQLRTSGLHCEQDDAHVGGTVPQTVPTWEQISSHVALSVELCEGPLLPGPVLFEEHAIAAKSSGGKTKPQTLVVVEAQRPAKRVDD
jgi:hypothetical protein